MEHRRRAFMQSLASLPLGALLVPKRAMAASPWLPKWSASTYVTQAQINAHVPPKHYPSNRRFAVGSSPGGDPALTETIVDFDSHAPKVNGLNPTYVWHWANRLPRLQVDRLAKGYAARNYIYITANPKATAGDKPAAGKWDSLCIGVTEDSRTGDTDRDGAASLMTYFKTQKGYCEIVCGFEGITPNDGKGDNYHYLKVASNGGRINPGRWYCIDRYMVPESGAGDKDGVVWINIDGTTVSTISDCQFFEKSWWGNINYMHELVRHMWGGNEEEYEPEYPSSQPMKHYIKYASRYICLNRTQALSMKLPTPTPYN